VPGGLGPDDARRTFGARIAMPRVDDGLEDFIELSLAEITDTSQLISESYERRGDEMALLERSIVPGLQGLLELRAAIRASDMQHEIDGRLVTRSESRPVTVGLADSDRFKHYVGLSPARARRLHRTEGFPIRVRGKGARRSYYVVLDEVEAWWKKQPAE
jgi:hypothetical protein